MAGFVRLARHPYSSITHHDLIKLLIVRALTQHNQTWEHFTGQSEIIQAPALLGGVPIEEEKEASAQLGGVEVEEEDHSPSNLVGERGR